MDKIAIMLYWCEGLKAAEKISVTNADAGIIRYFLKFLREDMKIPEEQIYGLIEIHEGEQSPELAKEYWQQQTGIINWWKTRVRPKGKDGKSGKKRGKLPYGLIRVQVTKSRKQWKLIMQEIEDMRQL